MLTQEASARAHLRRRSARLGADQVEWWKGAFVGGKLLVEAITLANNGQLVLGSYEDALMLPQEF